MWRSETRLTAGRTTLGLREIGRTLPCARRPGGTENSAFSTPTVEGNSAIAGLYEESDQSKFFVPCHHCKHEFVLQFEHLENTPKGTILANEDGKLIPTAVDAWFECPGCGMGG